MWQSAQDFPASARARGGATVTRLELTLQFGNRSLISVLPMPRTSGLLGLLIKKSCHKMMPPLLSTLVISRATLSFIRASRIELKTVDCNTTSKLAAGKLIWPALPHCNVTPAGHSLLASATRSARRSMPTRCSGRAPHLMNSRSQKPVPQPTSRILSLSNGG